MRMVPECRGVHVSCVYEQSRVGKHLGTCAWQREVIIDVYRSW